VEQILLFILLGLGSGALIAGIALGVVLSYRGSGVINLSTGAVAMLGGYAFWALNAVARRSLCGTELLRYHQQSGDATRRGMRLHDCLHNSRGADSSSLLIRMNLNDSA
jgi:hypothetical protein